MKAITLKFYASHDDARNIEAWINEGDRRRAISYSSPQAAPLEYVEARRSGLWPRRVTAEGDSLHVLIDLMIRFPAIASTAVAEPQK